MLLKDNNLLLAVVTHFRFQLLVRHASAAHETVRLHARVPSKLDALTPGAYVVTFPAVDVLFEKGREKIIEIPSIYLQLIHTQLNFSKML